MTKDKFSFGSNPSMKEVPPGTEAKFKFNGTPSIVMTDWGEKYSFPIVLISHDSYNSLPLDLVWESKSQCAKQLMAMYEKDDNSDLHKTFMKAYKESTWQLTRFDNGAYFIDQR